MRPRAVPPCQACPTPTPHSLLHLQSPPLWGINSREKGGEEEEVEEDEQVRMDKKKEAILGADRYGGIGGSQATIRYKYLATCSIYC